MSAILRERCFNHDAREAAARCPSCKRTFCRECVTEHDNRVLCTLCLKQVTAGSGTRTRALAGVGRVFQYGFGLLTAWFFFFLVGELLLRASDSFHDSSIWQVPWL